MGSTTPTNSGVVFMGPGRSASAPMVRSILDQPINGRSASVNIRVRLVQIRGGF